MRAGLVHVVVKDLQLHVHALGGGVIADGPGGLQELGVGLVLGLGGPFSRQEGDAPCSQVLRFVHGGDEGRLHFSAVLLVQGVGVQLGAQETGLRAVADLQVDLVQQRFASAFRSP